MVAVASFGPSAARAVLIATVVGAGGCGGQMVRLGDGAPPPYRFETPVRVAELAQGFPNGKATLTADELEIFFATNRNSNSDVWWATRGRADAPFDPPMSVAEVNGDTYEASPAISADGLTLWFGSNRSGGIGGLDVWESTRATRTSSWSTPVNLGLLNSPADDIPRPIGQHGQAMPMASTKVGPQNPSMGNYQLFLAERAAADAPFKAPVPIVELNHPDRLTVDGFLTDDGLALFFTSTQTSSATDAGRSDGDLFVAWRLSPSEPFAITRALDDLNTTFNENDPWLSADGKTLYFTSERDGIASIYTARVISN